MSVPVIHDIDGILIKRMQTNTPELMPPPFTIILILISTRDWLEDRCRVNALIQRLHGMNIFFSVEEIRYKRCQNAAGVSSFI